MDINEKNTQDLETPTPKEFREFKEKRELEKCNNRLELYIATQRAKDQKILLLENQIEDLRNNLAKEKERIRTSVKKAYDDLRNEKNSLGNKLVHMKTENEQLNSSLRNASLELTSKKEILRTAEKRLFALLKKREKDIEILNRLNTMVLKYKSANSAALKEAELLKSENEVLRSERDEFAQSVNVLKEKKDKRASDAHFSDKTYKDMVAAYEDEIKELKSKVSNIEENLRKEFSEQLSENLKSRQKSFHKEKASALNKLTKVYEEKLKEERKELDNSNQELEKVKLELETMEAQYEKSRTENDMILKSLEAENKKVALMEEKITELKLKPIRKEQHNAHILKLLKEQFRKKEADFERLMDSHLGLAIEIKAYREILDKEEERTRFSTTPGDRLTAVHTERTQGSDSDEENESLEELQRKLVQESSGTKPVSSKKKRPKKSPKERKQKRNLRTRRSSGRPEGVPSQSTKRKKTEPQEKPVEASETQTPVTVEEAVPTKNDEETEESHEERYLECIGTRKRIEVINRSDDKITFTNWVLYKDNNKESKVSFPDSLKPNEAFLVYPTEEVMKDDKDQGFKKVWNESAFETDNGLIVICNEMGSTMYSFEIVENEA